MDRIDIDRIEENGNSHANTNAEAEAKIMALNKMIALKKENNFLQKEICFLQTILKNNQTNNPLSLYVNSSFIADIDSSRMQLKEYLPNEKLETIYFINAKKGKKKGKNKPNKTKI